MIQRLSNLSKTLGKTSSAFLLGARGTGKTFLSREFMRDRRGLTIELLKGEIFTRYLSRPELFRKEVEAALRDDCLTVYIDEVQKLPRLLDEVHQLLSEHEGRVRFLLTGSSARKLKRGQANMLAGRAFTSYLYPLTFLEHQVNLEQALRFGTLPGIIFSENPESAIRAYSETYLKEEIIAEAATRKLDSFTRFLDLAAQYNGKSINLSQMGKEIGVAGSTISGYFEILMETLVIHQLPGWSQSVRKQLTQAPKYYFFDCGLLNALRGDLQVEVRPATRQFGDLFESHIVSEFFRLNSYFQKDRHFYYWRTKENQEVDLICSDSRFRSPIGIEIKSTSNPTEQDVKHLKVFGQEYPDSPLYCLCTTPNRFTIGPVQIVPWSEGIREILGLP